MELCGTRLRWMAMLAACAFALLAGHVERWALAQPAPVVRVVAFDPKIAPDQLRFLRQFDGAPAKDLFGDKQFRRLMKSFVPDCEFHYGRDMPLRDALEIVMDGARTPVQIRAGRYLTLSGDRGPYLLGRAMLWIDLQEGIGLGAFFFSPTNGEPTPALNVFSRQVRDEGLSLGQLPVAFAEDLEVWARDERIAPVTARYFLTGTNHKVLLEHDEDFCMGGSGAACAEMNADAADVDLYAADYVEQTKHRTNATAWMLSGEQVAWIGVRDRTCGVGPDSFGCRVRLTRERVQIIVGRGPLPRR